MNAVTANEAKQNLEGLIEQATSNIERIIICSDEGEKAVLLSLDEFNSWQ